MAAHQALPSLGFSRREHWSGLPCPSPVHESEKWKWSCSVMSNSQQPHELQPTRLLRPWDFFQARVLECVAIAFSDCLLSVQFRRSVVWPHESQHARPPCPSPIPGVYSNPCPSSRWCHPPNHLILCRPLLLLPPIPPSIRVFSNESALCMRWPKYWSFSFSISPSNDHPGLISFRDGLVRSPCSPRDSQESSPTPQFKSINFFGSQLSIPQKKGRA